MTALLTIVLTLAPSWELTTSLTFVKSIYPVSETGMWCSTSGGLFHYSTEEGIDSFMVYHEDIPWNDINDVLIDGSGRMWLATNGGGAAVQEESGWTIFTTYEGLPGSGAVHCLENTSGYIWAGSDGGFARGGDTGFVPINESSTGGVFKATEVTDIQCLDDTMWLATDRGVYALNLLLSPFTPGAWTSYEEETLSLGISGIYADSHGVYGYGGGGVAEKKGESWISILDYTGAGAADSTVFGLAFSGDTLVAGARGAFWYTGDQWEQWGTGWPATFYASCASNSCGRIWFGLGSTDMMLESFGLGLGFLDGGQWDTLVVESLPCSNLYQIAIDGDRMYIGSHNVGLMASYPDGGWRSFEWADGMPNVLRTYTSVNGPGGGIWTGSYHHGLSWLHDGGTWSIDDDTIITFVSESLAWAPPTTTQIIVPLLNNQVMMVCSQGTGYWVAQEAYWETEDEPSGIVGVEGNPLLGAMAWAPRSLTEGLAYKNTRKVFAVGNDSLWIAFKGESGCQLLTHGGNPADTSQDQWIPGPGVSFTMADGLPSNQVFCFARETNGGILAGTGAGIARYQSGSFSPVYGLSGSVKAMQIDDSGRIWCLLSNGIAMIENGSTTVYNTLNSPYIPTFRELDEFSYNDSNGSIYFSSIIGFWRIHTESTSGPAAGVLFYPQPYLPAEGSLYLSGASGEDSAITVDIFALDGKHLVSVGAPSASLWQWDGNVQGEPVASGMYMAVVRTESGTTQQARLAVVR